ncbi:MAG: hypothetical protein OCD76_15290 [Reichenbachiella sp.]
MQKLSIVIPTVQFKDILDETISSCLNLDQNCIEINIHINNSSNSSYLESKYWNSPLVKWYGGTYHSIAPIEESFSMAVNTASHNWIFVLSDDDVLKNNFLDFFNPDKFDQSTIFANRADIIDENSHVTRYNQDEMGRRIFNTKESVELFFDLKVHHHLSLFIFHKSLYSLCGPFENAGYPNGYYVDTVLHAKLMANCSRLVISPESNFLRRESNNQASAKFYFDHVNEYFDIIVNSMMKDNSFKKEVSDKYKTRKKFKTQMMRNRFFSEWAKLGKPVYNKRTLLKWEFIRKHICNWGTGFYFKLFSLGYILLNPLEKIIPKSLKNVLKSLIR